LVAADAAFYSVKNEAAAKVRAPTDSEQLYRLIPSSGSE
jgi:hypothetical protein